MEFVCGVMFWVEMCESIGKLTGVGELIGEVENFWLANSFNVLKE